MTNKNRNLLLMLKDIILKNTSIVGNNWENIVTDIDNELNNTKKLKYNPRLGEETWNIICKEIKNYVTEKKSFSQIKNILKSKYPNYNANTLILKYYKWKKGENNNGRN